LRFALTGGAQRYDPLIVGAFRNSRIDVSSTTGYTCDASRFALLQPRPSMKIRAPWVTWLAACLLVWLFRLLFRTVRIRFSEADPSTNPYSGHGRAVIYSVWHEAMIYPIFGGKHRRTVALVSKHQDGSLLAQGLGRIGVGLVRGSSSRSGAAALRELIHLPTDKNIVLTPDGPRGPRRRTKPGMTLIASRTGRAVVPSGCAAVRSWKLPGGWTHLEIPRPFTTVYLCTGARMEIPADASREMMTAMEERIQTEMDRLTEAAQQLATCG
jgi:lysophospholipid acyltransferase (LPLAT)-like uncharacterized protein